MKKKNVTEYYHPVLRKKARDVEPGKEASALIEKMKEVLKKEQGVGLAAPQIGVSKKIVIVNTDDEQMVSFLNPVIKEKSEEKMSVKEGCLSLRGIWFEVERSKKIKVEFLTEEGKKNEIEAEGMLAIVLQHEIDHLHGKLFIDNASFLKKIRLLSSYYFKKYVKAS